jgi:methionine synthase I (cobalamin-dependent)
LPPRFDAAAYPEPAQERAAYAELAELFAAEGADLIALEMLQDTRHAALACEAARACGLPFWLGVSCRLGPDKTSLVAFDYPETRLEQVLDALLPYGPTVVNLMHSPPSAIPDALALVRERWQGFAGVYPEIRSEGSNGALAPAALAALAEGWIERGARVVGGCCGTTPEHVRALKDAVTTRPSAS